MLDLIASLRARGKSDALAQMAADEIERQRAALERISKFNAYEPAGPAALTAEHAIRTIGQERLAEMGREVTDAVYAALIKPAAKRAPAKKAKR